MQPNGTVAVHKKGVVRYVMPNAVGKWEDLGFTVLGDNTTVASTQEQAQDPDAYEVEAEAKEDGALPSEMEKAADIIERAQKDLRPVRTEELIYVCEVLDIDPPNKATKSQILDLINAKIAE